MKEENTAQKRAAELTDRIWNAIPVSQQAFFKLLDLLEIEITDRVPTACVTTGTRSKLRINPDFVARHCRSDEKLVMLVMLVMHELFHVLLGHTRLFECATPAQNFAFNAVINSHLCLLFPGNPGVSLFRELYPADEFPLALLRPPDGWRTTAAKWRLSGEALRVHKALYTESSSTYRELFDLISRQMEKHDASADTGAPYGLEKLLGSHGPRPEEEADPDFLKGVREIVARWPMDERRSGRDQGGDSEALNIRVQDARKAAVSMIRNALWPLLDTEGGFRGAARHERGTVETCLPYRSLMDRRAGVAEACGAEPLFYRAMSSCPEIRRFEKAHVYLDVSGSMMDDLPLIYGALSPLREWLHSKIHCFSTRVFDISFSELTTGRVVSTWGTEINCVTGHMLSSRLRRVLVITDGWVGSIPSAHSAELKKRKIIVNSLVTADGDDDFALGLDGSVFRLGS